MKTAKEYKDSLRDRKIKVYLKGELETPRACRFLKKNAPFQQWKGAVFFRCQRCSIPAQRGHVVSAFRLAEVEVVAR